MDITTSRTGPGAPTDRHAIATPVRHGALPFPERSPTDDERDPCRCPGSRRVSASECPCRTDRTPRQAASGDRGPSRGSAAGGARRRGGRWGRATTSIIRTGPAAAGRIHCFPRYSRRSPALSRSVLRRTAPSSHRHRRRGRTPPARSALRTGSARGPGPTDAAVARIVSTLALVANADDERWSGGDLIGQVLTQVDELAETHHERA